MKVVAGLDVADQPIAAVSGQHHHRTTAKEVVATNIKNRKRKNTQDPEVDLKGRT